MNIFKNLSIMRITLMTLFALFISHNAVFAAARPAAPDDIRDAKREIPAYQIAATAPAVPAEAKSEEGPGAAVVVSEEEQKLIGNIQALFEKVKKEIIAAQAEAHNLDIEPDVDLETENVMDEHRGQLIDYIVEAVNGKYALALKAILVAMPDSRPAINLICDTIMREVFLGPSSSPGTSFFALTVMRQLNDPRIYAAIVDHYASDHHDSEDITDLYRVMQLASGDGVRLILDIIRLRYNGDSELVRQCLGKQHYRGAKTVFHFVVECKLPGCLDNIVALMEDKDALFIGKTIKNRDGKTAWELLKANKPLYDQCLAEYKKRRAEKKARERLSNAALTGAILPYAPITSEPRNIVADYLTHDPYYSDFDPTQENTEDADENDETEPGAGV